MYGIIIWDGFGAKFSRYSFFVLSKEMTFFLIIGILTLWHFTLGQKFFFVLNRKKKFFTVKSNFELLLWAIHSNDSIEGIYLNIWILRRYDFQLNEIFNNQKSSNETQNYPS